MNDSKLMSFNADVTTVVRATDYSDEITRERLLARDDSEHMGHAALEAMWDQRGIDIAGGVGGVGQGRRSLDLIGYTPGELHIGHCHGGTSRVLIFAGDGRAVPAGSAPSIGQRLLADTEFVEKMKEMPALWKAVVSGQVVIYWDMVFAPSGRIQDCLFPPRPSLCPPATWQHLTQPSVSDGRHDCGRPENQGGHNHERCAGSVFFEQLIEFVFDAATIQRLGTSG